MHLADHLEWFKNGWELKIIRFIYREVAALRLSVFVMAVSFALCLSGGAQALNAVSPAQKQTLVVGSEQNYPPFATGMTDATAGGFSVDLWKAVAAEEGLDYTFRVRPFHQLIQEFKEGKIDVLINLAQSDERRQFAGFTVPHVIVHGAIFVRQGQSSIRSESDLAGKSIIVMNADLAHDYAVSKGWGKQLVLVNSSAEGLRLLATGQHDAMLLSELSGLQTVQALGLVNIEALKVKADFVQKFAFAVHSGQSELLGQLNEGLALTKSNGTYTALYDKWFGIYEVKEVGLRDLLKYLIPLVVVFLVIARYFFYRQQVERKQARDLQRQGDIRLQATFDAIPDLLFELSLDGRYCDYHSPRTDLLAAPPQDLQGKLVADVLPSAAAATVLSALQEANENGRSNGRQFELPLPQGRLWFELSVARKASLAGEEARFIVLSREITERKQTEAELRIAATAFELQEGMFVADAAWAILRVNRTFSDVTGYSAEEAVGQRPHSLLGSADLEDAFDDSMAECVEHIGTWQGEIWSRRKDGEVFPAWLGITSVKADDGAITHFVATLTDITLRKAAEDEIKSLAFYDPLTGLPNRRLLMNRLEQALVGTTRFHRKGALLFVDLDDFKTLNDTLGHDKGDLLLQQVAKRLTSCIREGDTVARLGGDEFVVMLEDLSANSLEAAQQAETVGSKILVALNQPYQLARFSHHSTPSIGVTLLGEQQEAVDEPLKRADLAMYQAKAAGRNTLRFFDPQMQAVVSARAELETSLRQATLAKDQFVLYYQAQVTGEGKLTGAEALLRWKHPQRGMVSPAEFIPLAEETGVILQLGHWVLETACCQLALWSSRAEMAHLTIAVNVSARQFHQRDFVDQVLAVLARTGSNPQRLKLELTESLLISNVEDVIAKMTALKAQGVGFSLDDFGTGYSSLSYLKRLPLDQLKIDQGFVRDILVDPNDAAIAKMVVALAGSLGLAVIAEGVETEAQRDFLADQGCHAYQGYLFSRPLPLEAFEAFALNFDLNSMTAACC